MQADLETLETEVEMARMLYRYAQTVRCGKRRPELAAVASRHEIAFKKELDRLEEELQRAQTPDLALSAHHEEAA